MGNLQGSNRKPAALDDYSTTLSAAREGWETAERDEACRFMSLVAPITDGVEFPYDNKPEHGSFVNLQGLHIHTYIWYPAIKNHSRGDPTLADAAGGASALLRNGSASHARAASPAKADRPVSPFSGQDKLQREQQRAASTAVSYFASRSGATACAFQRAFSASGGASFTKSAPSASPAGPPLDQVLLDKADAASACRGVVILLHGYCNHSRLAWLSKQLPHDHARRDPTVVGYGIHSTASAPRSASSKFSTGEAQQRRTPATAGHGGSAVSGANACAENKPGKGKTAEDGASRRTQDEVDRRVPSKLSIHAEESGNGDGDTGHLSEALSDQHASAAWHIHYRGSWVEALNKAGFIVAAMDFQGHGFSQGWQGKRASVNRLDDFALDVIQFTAIVRRRCQYLRAVYRHHCSQGCGRETNSGDSHSEGDKRADAETAKEAATPGHETKATDATREDHAHERDRGVDEDGNVPVFLVGLSLGGWVAARTVQLLGDAKALASLSSVCDLNAPLPPLPGFSGKTPETRDSSPSVGASRPSPTFGSVSGCVLLSPMLDLSFVKAASKYHIYRPVLGRLAEWTPNMVVSRPHPNLQYPYLEAYMQRDKYTYKGGSRVRMVREMFEGTEAILQPECLSLVSETTCGALLIIHNLLDDTCGLEGSLRFFHGVDRVSDKIFLAVNAHVAGSPAAGKARCPSRLANDSQGRSVGIYEAEDVLLATPAATALEQEAALLHARQGAGQGHGSADEREAVHGSECRGGGVRECAEQQTERQQNGVHYQESESPKPHSQEQPRELARAPKDGSGGKEPRSEEAESQGRAGDCTHELQRTLPEAVTSTEGEEREVERLDKEQPAEVETTSRRGKEIEECGSAEECPQLKTGDRAPVPERSPGEMGVDALGDEKHEDRETTVDGGEASHAQPRRRALLSYDEEGSRVATESDRSPRACRVSQSLAMSTSVDSRPSAGDSKNEASGAFSLQEVAWPFHSASSGVQSVATEPEGPRVLPKNLYVECNVEASLLEKVRAYADPQLHGLDLHHSLPSEPDGEMILRRVMQWLLQHAPDELHRGQEGAQNERQGLLRGGHETGCAAASRAP
ncbi:hypothetical protein BESB_060210 [Besnoitia besnoiti]|uniref:Serine aminopeptidase S33 domain-containing protein n=1 Tax=Besnoitia besnoiti TaxID=94643 RepID=A0A2A9MD45_BESBE|nr:hypothetical protein BESB_060210 [Besnoitia besnoiti]PFH35134.1 hypothetical protein BESB_060210 [Besnoitia besnoiti]